MSDLIPSELMDTPPACKLVYLGLVHHSECRAEVLWEALGTSEGTIYPALDALEERGLAAKRPALHGTGYHWRLADDDPAITGEISGGEKVW